MTTCARWRCWSRAPTNTPDSTPMQNVERIYPLSPMQQIVLAEGLHTSNRQLYVEQMTWTVSGDLDVDALTRAWRAVIARHAALRTAFFWEGLEQPLQVVRGSVETAVAIHDWREASAAEQAYRFQQLVDAERARGFELSTAPLTRLAVGRVADRRYRFVWSCHHLIMDGWSASLFLQELFGGYAVLQRGDILPIAPAPRYEAYIAWLQQRDLREAESHWRRTLAGLPSARPANHPIASGADDALRYQMLTHVIPAAVAEPLRVAARRDRLTVNTILQGAWALTLADGHGLSDVVFGATVSGRPSDLPGADAMIGMFITVTPVRARIDRRIPIGEWLRNLQQAQGEARRYDYCSPIQLQQWSGLPAGEPLLDTMLTFQNLPGVEIRHAQIAGIEIEDFRKVRPEEGFGYTLLLEVVPQDALELYLTAPAAGRPAASVLAHFVELLEPLTSNTAKPLDALPRLAARDRQQILVDWNEPAHAARQPAACLHTLIEAQVDRHPEALAVTCEGRHDTYRELDDGANRLAHALVRRGIASEELVGICLERSADLVVALLGVWKAGGACLPLDPSYPHERLRYLIEDSGARLLVTHAAMADETAEMLAVDRDRVLCLDGPEVTSERAARPVRPIALQQLAYVIYTSGSTGRPKGVMVEHALAAAHFQLFADWCALAPGDRFLQFAPIGFDASLEQILPALMTGAAVVLRGVDPWEPREFLTRCAALGVTAADLTAAYWRRVARDSAAGDAALASALRLIIVGGEAFPAETTLAWPPADGRARRLVNAYGPTEAIVTATAHDLEAVDGTGSERLVPIGRPLPQRAVYVLDALAAPTPTGVPGELYVGGPLLARGYRYRPSVTAQRFVPDPFGEVPGARLYRTGDRVRWREDGELEFLGRVDEQVKVRGYRIEPGEIEGVLLEHPAIAEATVLAVPDQAGENRLVAYVVAAGIRASAAELRAYLAGRLPDYMIPASIMTLDALPLTPNGKVDRKALPMPDDTVAARSYTEPRRVVEEVLAGIWSDVLGKARVGVDENFFDLGGHSLLAMRVLSRVRDAFAVAVPLRALFETQTVRLLAARVERLRGRGEELERSPMPRVPREGGLPLSFAQHGLWFLHQLDPESPAYNIPVALHFAGHLRVDTLTWALTEVMRRHEVLRTTFTITAAGDPVQIVGEPAPFPLRVVDLTRVDAASRGLLLERLRRAEAARPFDLTRGPLCRCTLLRLGPRDNVVLFTLHHVVSDEWSAGILVRDVTECYGARLRQQTPSLPALDAQYADYAAWQRALAGGPLWERQLDWWRERLASTPPAMHLPFDRPRPRRISGRGMRHAITLDADLLRAVTATCRAECATPFMLMTAAFAMLLHQYVEGDDVWIGANAANRAHPQTEPLIGYFVNQVVLRVSLSGDPSCQELVRRAREIILDASAHEEVPFEQVVDAVQPGRRIDDAPLFRAKIDFIDDRLLQDLVLPGLSIGLLDTDDTPVRYDLLFTVAEIETGMRLSLSYAPRLFEAATIARMLDHIVAILRIITTQPQASLAAVAAQLARLDDEARRAARTRIRNATLERLAAHRAPAVVPSSR
jgi:amino acid adenylation domain-containing protein